MTFLQCFETDQAETARLAAAPRWQQEPQAEPAAGDLP